MRGLARKENIAYNSSWNERATTSTSKLHLFLVEFFYREINSFISGTALHLNGL